MSRSRLYFCAFWFVCLLAGCGLFTTVESPEADKQCDVENERQGDLLCVDGRWRNVPQQRCPVEGERQGDLVCRNGSWEYSPLDLTMTDMGNSDQGGSDKGLDAGPKTIDMPSSKDVETKDTETEDIKEQDIPVMSGDCFRGQRQGDKICLSGSWVSVACGQNGQKKDGHVCVASKWKAECLAPKPNGNVTCFLGHWGKDIDSQGTCEANNCERDCGAGYCAQGCQGTNIRCELDCEQECLQVCKSGTSCSARCRDGYCDMICEPGATCDFRCDGGDCNIVAMAKSKVTIDCEGGYCKSTCLDGATCETTSCEKGYCETTCSGSATCSGNCTGGYCKGVCRDKSQCTYSCEDYCSLDCSTTNTCELTCVDKGSCQ